MRLSNTARFPLLLLLLLVTAVTVAACGGGDNEEGGDSDAAGDDSGAITAVQTYLQAIVDSDEDTLRQVTCAERESEVPMRARSFAAVNAELRDVSCRLNGTEGEYTLVTCDGIIFAEYTGGQDNEIPLETYRAIEEDGEWKACGEGGAGPDPEGPTELPPDDTPEPGTG